MKAKPLQTSLALHLSQDLKNKIGAVAAAWRDAKIALNNPCKYLYPKLLWFDLEEVCRALGYIHYVT